MVQTFARSVLVQLSEHFSSADFNCHCARPECFITLINSSLPEALERLWENVGSIKITSGFRCEKHNADIGGAADSQHCLGFAADCKSLEGKSGTDVAGAAESIPKFKSGGIGIYSTFAHCDIRENGPARWKSGLKMSLIRPC